MQIQLNQNDIETAVRNYVSAMGISRPIDEIQFNVSRKGGQSIEAEIDLADCTGGARPQPSVSGQTSEPVKTGTQPAAEPAPEKDEEPEQAEEPAPFTPDEEASNDGEGEQEEEAPAAEGGKSLFS